MKAATIHQPWASLIAVGAKRYETRGWATNYRGPIAIHAGTKKYKDFGFLGSKIIEKMENVLITGGQTYLFADLPYGAVIATAELVGCYKMHGHSSVQTPGWLETPTGKRLPTEQEEMFGDWMPGRYAWELANVKLLDEPIPARGQQGLWNWEDEIC